MFNDSFSMAAMEKSMSALWQRKSLIAHNMANEDTPGFKAKRLQFESLLRAELDQARTERLTNRQRTERFMAVAAVEYDDPAGAVRADGNNVDTLAEQIELARTQMQYDALQRKVNGHYQTLKYAISGGR